MQEIIRYRSICGDDYRHVWVVGDLHGCYQQLKQQLVARNFDERCDLLIAVGDLIDRGPDSAACLALLDAPGLPQWSAIMNVWRKPCCKGGIATTGVTMAGTGISI
ncbi:MAG: metallophosphoesterase [Symbiopectobacterium sp.]|uniref:metallophosphoesterase n=1 Tax=Symbiopectobacterium sp. TaxID=2952789 RepID=UPI0039E7F98A